MHECREEVNWLLWKMETGHIVAQSVGICVDHHAIALAAP